jgi:hypothetical protein
MKAVVVYESLWGNTGAVARAIAEGIGPDARACSTAEVTPEAAAEVDLLVAGAPLQAFSLPTARIRGSITADTGPVPDLSAPTLRSWLERLPAGHGGYAAFDTKIRWSPGSAASVIDEELTRAGFKAVARSQHFVVAGKFGPLKDGEIERARAWGRELAEAARN